MMDNKQLLMMDSDDVIEIPPPPEASRSISSKQKQEQKLKQAIHHEVIDVDEYEDSADLMILDDRIDTKNKWKAVKDNYFGRDKVKDAFANNPFVPSSASNIVDLDDDLGSDLLSYGGSAHVDFFGDFMDFDDYSFAQAYFESANIPPGVEAHIPSLQDSVYNARQVISGSNAFNTANQMHTVGTWSSNTAHVSKKLNSLSSSSFQIPVDPACCSLGVGPSSSSQLSQTSQVKPCRIAENSDKIMDPDAYAFLQAYFESANIPPGVEASIPSLQDSIVNTKNTVNGSGLLNSINEIDDYAFSHADFKGLDFPPFQYGNVNTKDTVGGIASQNIGNQKSTKLLGSWSSKPAHVSNRWKSGGSSGFSIPVVSESHASHSSPLGPSSPWPLPHIPQISKTPIADKTPAASQHGQSAPYLPPSLSKQMLGFSSSFLPNPLNKFMPFHQFGSEFNIHSGKKPVLPEEAVVRTSRNMKEADVLRNFQVFKKFDTVEDHVDHHYTSEGSSMKQPPKNWAKRIQEEWRILENDLPDAIFVRVYETRMDLLRAVIIGAEGTPYHNGLFFFDIFFPAGYPNVPPHVYYHSWGLRLNPNLYNSGKVCLSLLGTWSGGKNEKWLPGVSTVLQVLVSIQALVLNQKPYFNEPGFARMINSVEGERQSQQYTENTFFLSLKTMVYTMRKPPKHFDDFVFGHFYKHAHDILMACKAYMDGAEVGSLVKGTVQGVNKTMKSCSQSFRQSLPAYVDMLLKEFSAIGVKDIENFQVVAKAANNQLGNRPLPKAAI